MDNIDLSALNNAQLNALNQINGPVMVLAGAGSGKTRLVTYRIAHLVDKLSVPPENILAITFTNKAAGEMKERLVSLLGERSYDIWISTFHSMCVKILRKHISSLKTSIPGSFFDSNFSIYTDTEKDRTIKTVLQNLKIEKEGFAQRLSFHISNAKNKNLSPWEYQKYNQDLPDIEDITKAYSAYQNFLASNNALDFDDLLVKTYELFCEYPDILYRYQTKFQYIHIDEFQDTNHVQYLIAKKLADVHKNIFVVGDEDQCIYSWRGASIQNIRDFAKDFPGYKMLKLEQNYRSSKEILTIANKLIKNNLQRNEKELWTENNIGTKVDYYKASDEFEEAEYVANQISYLVKERGYRYSDFAILTRLNAMSANFEEKFLNYNIPYKVFGGNKFFDRLEIKNLVSYLKFLTNPYDSTSFARIVNYPKRGIGDTTISNVLHLAEFHGTTVFHLIINSDEYLLDSAIEKRIKPFKDVLILLNNALESMEGIDFINYLIKQIDFKSIYSSNSEEDISRLLNIDSFVVMAQEFFKNNPKSTISEFLQSITLVSDIDDYDETSDNVTIATVHAVKGLEFRCVYVAGLEEKMFPIIRGYSSEKDMEEERRLMFVAITRAKERLTLSYAKSRFMYGRRDYSLPSRFLKECGILDDATSFSSHSATPYSSYSSYANTSKPKTAQSEYSSFISSGKTNFSINKFQTSSEKKQNENLAQKFSVGRKVSHPKFGSGVITSNEGIAITKCVSINFEGFGIKTLSTEYAPLTLID